MQLPREGPVMGIFHKAAPLRGPRVPLRFPSPSQVPRQHLKKLSVGKDRNGIPKSLTKRQVYFCHLQQEHRDVLQAPGSIPGRELAGGEVSWGGFKDLFL